MLFFLFFFGFPPVHLQENLKRIISFNTEGSATVYVLGGIQINMPGPMPGLFMPRMFKKFTRHSQTSLEHVIGIPDEDTPQSTDP